jgi:hypothetical protein
MSQIVHGKSESCPLPPPPRAVLRRGLFDVPPDQNGNAPIVAVKERNRSIGIPGLDCLEELLVAR